MLFNAGHSLWVDIKLIQSCHHTTGALLHQYGHRWNPPHVCHHWPTLKLVSQHFKHADSKGSLLGWYGDELFPFKHAKASNNQMSFTHDSKHEQYKKETWLNVQSRSWRAFQRCYDNEQTYAETSTVLVSVQKRFIGSYLLARTVSFYCIVSDRDGCTVPGLHSTISGF